MNRIFLFLFLLFTTPCYAEDISILQHITFNRAHPPGSVIIRYGGIEGLIRSEITRQFHSLHREYLQTYFNDRPLEIRDRIISMNYLQADVNSGGAWYDRQWFYSQPYSKGGTFDTPIHLFYGRQTDVLNLGFARITNKFRFKLKEFDVSLSELVDNKSQSPPRYDWHLKIKPSLRFSIKQIIRRAQLSIFLNYVYRQIRLLTIEIYGSYHIRNSEARAGINIFFLLW